MAKPKVSIIIPTYNEEKYIGKCLENWFNQDYPLEDYEILIFDGKSEDNTLNVIQQIQKKYSFKNLHIYPNKKRKQVYAFNEGILKAKGEYFTIFGAHAYPETNFLTKNICTFERIGKNEPKLCGVGGTIKKVSENRFGKIPEIIYSSFLSGSSPFWYVNKEFFVNTIVFGMYDKKKISEYNIWFDEDFKVGNDFEFNLRLIEKGFKLCLNPNIVSYYYTRPTLKKFITQTINYGAVKALMLKKGYFNILWFFPFGWVIIIVSLLFTNILAVIYFLIIILESLRLLFLKKDIFYITLLLILPIFHTIISLGFFKGIFLKKHDLFK